MSDLETREVYSDPTQLDSSYATFYKGHFLVMDVMIYGKLVPENAIVICVE